MAGINKSPYRILHRPIITEKAASAGSAGNCFLFEVCPKANKTEIKRAVEKVFDVEVKSVRTVNILGKLKRVMNRTGHKKDRKKAYVTLQPGHKISVIEGL